MNNGGPWFNSAVKTWWALLSWRLTGQYVSYLFRDLGGNSNSPTEMVSTALSETLMTCWHSRLMKSYLHTSSDLQEKPNYKETKWSCTSLPDNYRHCWSPVSDKHESLPLIVPVIHSAETNMQKALNHVSYHFCDLTKVSVSVILLCQSDHSLCEQPDTQHFPILGGQSHGPDVTYSLLDGTWLGSPTTEVRLLIHPRTALVH